MAPRHLLFVLQNEKAGPLGQESSGRQENSGLAITASLALSASSRRWMPTCSVTTALLGSAPQFLPPPPRESLTHVGKAQPLTTSSRSYLRNLKLDLPPCVSQGRASVCTRKCICVALRVKWEPSRLMAICWGLSELGDTLSWGSATTF